MKPRAPARPAVETTTKKGSIWFPKDASGAPRRWPSGRTRYRGKVMWPDGKRQDVAVKELHCDDEETAAAYIATLQIEIDANGAALIAQALPVVDPREAADWFTLWIATKKAKGQTSTADRTGHYERHIRPALAGKHVRDWTSDDMRTLVAVLDAKVRDEDIAPKTAKNIWGTATKMCADACKSKVPELRVRTENPSKDVEGPDPGADREKQFLYPSEFVQLVACEDIPLRWRRAVALSVGLYCRAGELRALRWEDVDLEHGSVHIHRSFERRTREEKGTKTGKGRRVPIEPSLVSLLEAMHRESGGEGTVCPIPNRMADRMRGWLLRAGLTRSELTDEASRTTRPLAWHDLRATGTTWMAVRGDEAMKIMQRAGHLDIGTTMKYVRTAEAIGTGFGDPFPALPEALLVSTPWHSLDPEPSKSRPRMSTPVSTSDSGGHKPRQNGAGHGIRKREESLPASIHADIRTVADGRTAPADTRNTPKCADPRRVDIGVDKSGCSLHASDLTRVIAISAAIEAMTAGHVRTLAGDLRSALEAMLGPSADVVPIVAARKR